MSTELSQLPTELKKSVHQLLTEVLPNPATGSPSQYTLSTFNNVRAEQQTALKTATINIETHLDQIHKQCELIKGRTLQYCIDYKNAEEIGKSRGNGRNNGLTAQQTQQTQQVAELTEEDCLLRDILLLEKEIQTGQITIRNQKTRLELAQSMVSQVNRENNKQEERMFE